MVIGAIELIVVLNPMVAPGHTPEGATIETTGDSVTNTVSENVNVQLYWLITVN